MPSWKKVITSGSDAELNSLYAPSITGSLHGTASWAQNATSASYALSSSYAVSSSYASSSTLSDSTLQTNVLVLNQTGFNIAKGTVVRITGSNNASDTPRITTASYESDDNSANTLGITTQVITNGSQGYIITEGILTGIDTSNYISGQLIYLGATGSITGSSPLAPLHTVRLGEVIREQSNAGSIYVRIDNGTELGELHDVRDTTTTSSYGDLLVKSGSVWINSKQLTGSYELTGSLTATSFTGSLQGTASWANNATTASYATNAANAFIQGGNSFGTAATIGTNDTQNLNIETNNSTRIFVSSSGIVGIGTTAPREQLGIAGGGMRLETSPGSEASTIRQTSFHSTLYLASNLYYSGSAAPETNSYYILDSGSNNRGGSLLYLKTNGGGGANKDNGFFFYTATTSSGANTLATLTENFRIIPGTASFSNNNVGIGTTSPSAKLHVNNTSALNSLLIEDDTNPDTSPFVIDNVGNVAIGVSSATAKLTVATSITAAYPTSSGTTQAGYYTRLRNAGSNLVLDIGGNGGAGNWLQSTNQTDLSLTYPILLNPNGGNVGIGTTSTTAKLHVKDATVLDSGSGSFYLISTTEGGVGGSNRLFHDEYRYREADGSTWFTSRLHDAVSIDASYKTPGVDTKTWWQRDPYNIIQSWGNNNNTYMTLNLDKLGLGITSPTAKLHVTNTTPSASFLVEDSTNPDSSPFIIDNAGNVGIGILTPSSKLDISGSLQVTGSTSITSNSGSFSFTSDLGGYARGYLYAFDTEVGMGTSYGSFVTNPSDNTVRMSSANSAIWFDPTGGNGFNGLLGSSTTASIVIRSGRIKMFGPGSTGGTASSVEITGSLNVSGSATILRTPTIITGSTDITGSLTVTGSFDASSYSNKIIAITELTSSALVTHTVGTTNFTAINLNSDATNRYAKATFVAPQSGRVQINMEFDMTIVNSAAVQMIGLHNTSSATSTPSEGWYRINADNDATSGQFYATFIKTGLTPGTTYNYYFMGVCNFSGNTVRISNLQTGAYSAGSDLPAPLRIYVYDLGNALITSNPSS